jgi:hypothetical protein
MFKNRWLRWLICETVVALRKSRHTGYLKLFINVEMDENIKLRDWAVDLAQQKTTRPALPDDQYQRGFRRICLQAHNWICCCLYKIVAAQGTRPRCSTQTAIAELESMKWDPLVTVLSGNNF